MKVQDVLLKAMAKKITCWEAAGILGVTDRTMRRWRERLETEGYSGLADRRRGRPSRKRIPLATVEKVLKLYQEKYFDLNMQHFHEKLREEEGWTWGLRPVSMTPRSDAATESAKARKRAVRMADSLVVELQTEL